MNQAYLQRLTRKGFQKKILIANKGNTPELVSNNPAFGSHCRKKIWETYIMLKKSQ